MTQSQSLIEMFRSNGGRLRRNDILQSGFLAASYRQRMTDLRKQGYDIACEDKDGDTVFILRQEPPRYEPNGQAVML